MKGSRTSGKENTGSEGSSWSKGEEIADEVG